MLNKFEKLKYTYLHVKYRNRLIVHHTLDKGLGALYLLIHCKHTHADTHKHTDMRWKIEPQKLNTMLEFTKPVSSKLYLCFGLLPQSPVIVLLYHSYFFWWPKIEWILCAYILILCLYCWHSQLFTLCPIMFLQKNILALPEEK